MHSLWDDCDFSSSGFTVYYLKGKTGFTSQEWDGYKTVSKDEIK